MDHPRYRATENGLTVGFLFKALSASELSGPVLIGLLGGLGLQQSAARNALTRMVRVNALEARRVGRTGLFRLASHPPAKPRQMDCTLPEDPWDGTFRCLIYDIPERERNFRDRFRYLASVDSYGQLRPGVMISPRAHSSWIGEVIAQRPRGTRIHQTELKPVDLAEARRMALATWELPQLRRRYQTVIATMEAALDEDLTEGQGSPEWLWRHLDRWRRIDSEVVRLESEDPDLPQALLPAQWPARRFRDRADRLRRSWGLHLIPRLRELASSLDHAGLCEYWPRAWPDSTVRDAVGQ